MSLYEITSLKEYDEKTNNYHGSKDAYFNKIYCNNIYTNDENITTAGYIKGLSAFGGTSTSVDTSYNVLLDGLSRYNIPSNLIKADSIIQIKYSFLGSGIAGLMHTSILQLGDNNNIFSVEQPRCNIISSGAYCVNICFNIFISSRNGNACTAIVDGILTGQNVYTFDELINNATFNIDSNGLSFNVLHKVTQSSPNTYLYNRGVVIVQKIQ